MNAETTRRPAPAATTTGVSMQAVLASFQGLPQLTLVAIAVAVTVVVALLDLATGDIGAMKYAYVIPVLLMACSANARATLAVIASTVAAELAVDIIANRTVSPASALGVLARTFVECVIAALVIELQVLVARQTLLADTDPLTGLANRRMFFRAAAAEIARQTRNDQPMAMLYLDLDGFKQLNDELGHAAGDALLVAFAAHLRSETRASDIVARLGGDEFVILLPEADREAVEALADRIQRVPVAAGHGSRVRASIGIVAYCPPFPNIDTMVAEAEWLMYKSKRRSAVERQQGSASILWSDNPTAIVDLRDEIDVRDRVVAPEPASPPAVAHPSSPVE